METGFWTSRRHIFTGMTLISVPYRYDFDIGAWKLGSGLVTDTGLLLQVVAPNSFEVCAQHLWV